MKNLTTLSLITATIILGLTGCGSSPSSSGSSVTTNNTTYIAFSADATKRLDVLYKTDGSSINTTEVSNVMIPSTPSQYEYEFLDNFLVYGDHLYTNRVQKRNNCLFSCLEQEQMATNTTTDNTIYLNMKTSNLVGAIKVGVIKRYITIHGMYMSNKDLSSSSVLEKYKINRISTTGAISTITLPSPYAPNFLSGHVQVNSDIYYAARAYYTPDTDNRPSTYGLLKLDTSSNTVSEIISARGLLYHSMYNVNGMIYASASTNNSSGIYVYDPTTPNIAPNLIATYHELPSYGQVINGKLYYLASTTSGARTLYELDPSNNAITTHATGINPIYFKEIFTYNGNIYYNDGNTLYKQDGTQVATLPDGEVYEANGKLYFAGNGNGIELFQYDGTTVSMVLDINPGVGNSTPRHITELNGDIVFQASPDGISNKLYKYDGSTLSTLN